MRLRRCTIDSSCVIALDHLDLIPGLSLLFSIVLVPKAVREDLFKRRISKDRLKSFFEVYAFLQPCNDYDNGTVDFLLAEKTREGKQDRGEAETVVQASQLGATVIVDDPWGRELAAGYDLEFHGTVWILQRFHELDLLSSVAVRDCFKSLRLRKAHLPWQIIDAFLVQIGQEPL
jgi:predicted nucleic acid-binding protein